MTQKRKRHTEEFKAKVALEAVKGLKTSSELSAQHKVHPMVISQWKRKLMNGASTIFTRSGGTSQSVEEVTAPLYQKIGQLQTELDWLKKKL